jgi:hypothetical protein
MYEWPDGYAPVDEGEPLITLAMGEARSGLRAGAVLPGRISGGVFEDMDADGLRAAYDPPLAGVNVAAVSRHGEAGAVTDESGSYVIEGLPPGEYAVRFTLPNGMMFTRRRDGGSMAEAVDDITSSTLVMALGMGETLERVDAGAVRVGAIGDYAWHDRNLNGIQDDGEPGMAGLKLALERAVDGQWLTISQTETDADGFYEFDNVRPGTYRIVVADMDSMGDWWPTRRAIRLPEIDSKLRSYADTHMATEMMLVESNKHVRNADLGFVGVSDARAAKWTVDEGGEIIAP